MSFKSCVLALACLLVTALATSAEAQRSYPLTGNARFQIGNGLPIPIGVTATPNGKILAVGGARITQTSGPDPKQIALEAHQLTHPGGVFTLVTFLFGSPGPQIRTNFSIGFPAAGGGPGTAPNPTTPRSGKTFKAGGRTGGPTVTFCPGQSVTPTGNPACTDPGTPQHPIAGFMKYTATGAQFGGAMRGNAGGSGDIAWLVLAPSPPAPCDHAGPTGSPGGAPCVVIYASVTLPGTGVVGGPFGVAVTLPGGPPPAPGGLRNAKVGAGGTVLSVTSPGLGPGVANPVTSFGGPWTTGMLTVNQTGAVGTPEIFILTGSDNRVNGIGTLSLVAGGLSDRVLSGAAANRGWLNLTIGGDTPGLSGWGIGFLAILLAGAGVRRARDAMAR